MSDLKSNIYIGIIVDNNDPDKMGRCKIRVKNIYDKIPDEDLPWASPWKDLNGNSFILPEKGKVVSVVFDNGNKYKPEYIYANHYNANLEQKLKDLEGDDYMSMRAVVFDHKTQIYSNDSEGLKIDYKLSNININGNGNINMNLRDSNSRLMLGSDDASQSAVLGNNFMDWMDTLVNELLTGPYLDSTGVKVVTQPGLVKVLSKYKSIRKDFLSNNVWVADNNDIKAQDRVYIGQSGDNWKSTRDQNNLTSVDNSGQYNPEQRPDNGRVSLKSESSAPPDITQSTIGSENLPSLPRPLISEFQNGRIPLERLKQNKNLAKFLDSPRDHLLTNASDALDALVAAYNAASFPGKQPLQFTDGYRPYEAQQSLWNRLGSGLAARPGRSNHGWGIAIDVWYGVRTSLCKNNKKRAAGYKHPVYQWLHKNAWKFGFYNPVPLRDGLRTDEWWHWEYWGSKGEPEPLIAAYSEPFTSDDIAIIKSYGGSYYA